jgi:hypothetical protein
LQFHFYPLRFEFRALGPIRFPSGKAANTLRGGLGLAFRRIACSPECAGAADCAQRATCAYARFFEPSAVGLQTRSPSGLTDWPRPFVFRARHLDGTAISDGEAFWFYLNFFSPERSAIGYFAQAFEALGREGLGPERGHAELVSAPDEDLTPVSLDLSPRAEAPSRIRVEFLSPTELKHDQGIVERPEFPVLFRRIRDRISTLRQLYDGGPLEVDFQGSAARAGDVRMTRCEMRRVDVERRSGRTGQSHSIGGFVGVAEYEGNLGEFLPYLEAAQWTGVGRQAVWGKGEIRVGEAA